MYHSSIPNPNLDAVLGKEAGDAYCKAADLQQVLMENDDASMSYVNASKCYKKGFPEGFFSSPFAKINVEG